MVQYHSTLNLRGSLFHMFHVSDNDFKMTQLILTKYDWISENALNCMD